MVKLLLITHDEILAMAYTSHLAKAGFEVEHASAGQAGLAKARQWSPDVILLDLALPGMHGLDVLKWLRDVPWLVKVPVVLLLEHTVDSETLQQCLVWGADSYLHKDVCSLGDLTNHMQAVRQASASS